MHIYIIKYTLTGF